MFVKISDLKAKAKIEVDEYLSSKSKSMIPAFFGHPATNIEWFKKASNFYTLSIKHDSDKKVKLLMNALIDIYKCSILMQQSKFNDEKVTVLQKKIETSYINFVMNFINNNLDNSDSITNNFQLIEKSISVLEEVNSMLANNFYKILKSFTNKRDYHDKILSLLDITEREYTKIITTQINLNYRNNREYYKKNQRFEEEIMTKIFNKINKLFHYFQNEITNEQQKQNPSIIQMLFFIDKFERVIDPLNSLMEYQFQNKFNDLKYNLLKVKSFLDNDYQTVIDTYGYLSLPHKNIDIKRILKSHKIMKKIQFENWKYYFEISELEPSLESIFKTIDTALQQYFKTDLNRYFKTYNDITDIIDFNEKFTELVKFSEHLHTRLKDDRFGEYLSEKLTNMISEIELEIEDILLTELKIKISKVHNIAEAKSIFDLFFEKYLLLNNTELLHALQISKKQITTIAKSKFNNDEFIKIINQQFSFEEPNTEIFEHHKLFSSSPTNTIPTRIILIDNFTLQNYIFLNKPIITIGRSDDNDIVLPIEWISGHHCIINLETEEIYDLESTNGTFINNIKTSKSDLISTYSIDISNIFSFDLFINEDSYTIKFSHIKQKSASIKPELTSELQATSFILSNSHSNIFINPVSGRVLSKSESNIDNLITIAPDRTSYSVNGNISKLNKGLNQISDRFTLKL